MHVVITGGAGFIGSHLTRNLLSRDYRVTIIDNMSTGSRRNLRDMATHPNLTIVNSSITDEFVLDRLASGADMLVHLAAAVGVKLILDKPTESIMTNVVGTYNVLEAAARYGCRTLVASTSEVYGKSHQIPYKEDGDSTLGPTIMDRWSYAASKMIDEFLTLGAARQHEIDVVITRFFNVVGPGQVGTFGMVIPRFVNQALNNEPITIYDDGAQIRCFSHVLDAVDALVRLIEATDLEDAQIFNVGNDEEITILELAKLVIEITNSQSEIAFVPYGEAYRKGFEDIVKRVPDVSKIKDAIGWKASRGIRQIVSDVVEYEQNARGILPISDAALEILPNGSVKPEAVLEPN